LWSDQVVSEPGKPERTVLAEIERPIVRIVPVVWPAFLAIALVIAVFFALPDPLLAGPGSWISMVMAVCLVILAVVVIIDHYVWPGNPKLRVGTRVFGIFVTVALTSVVVYSVFALVRELPNGRIEPLNLLWNGALIWGINVLVFAVWYWEIDAGGPHAREEASAYGPVDFVFPQFSADDDTLHAGWKPNFVDYLFLAFNTSTAFSPTDTMVLSRCAKVLMMVQSTISLVVFGVLLARAVGAIGDTVIPSSVPSDTT
jgi:hypothetical protein